MRDHLWFLLRGFRCFKSMAKFPAWKLTLRMLSVGDFSGKSCISQKVIWPLLAPSQNALRSPAQDCARIFQTPTNQNRFQNDSRPIRYCLRPDNIKIKNLKLYVWKCIITCSLSESRQVAGHKGSLSSEIKYKGTGCTVGCTFTYTLLRIIISSSENVYFQYIICNHSKIT